METAQIVHLNKKNVTENDSNNEQGTPSVLQLLYGDGGDFGPAPLQNTVIPTDDFELVMNVLNKLTSTIYHSNTAINDLYLLTDDLTNVTY